MSKARKYPVPDYKVPEGMEIVGYLNRDNKFYYRYAEAAEYNARLPVVRQPNGTWVTGSGPPEVVVPVFAFSSDADLINT